MDVLDNTLKTPEDIKETFGYKVLGALPHLDRLSEDVREDAFRALKNSVRYAMSSKNVRSLAVISPGRQDGRTTVAFRLAEELARSGSKVLYINADLRKPVPVKTIQEVGMKGLTDYLSGDASLEDILEPPGLREFYSIPSGIVPPDALTLLDSQCFMRLVSQVAGQFDGVILDTPALEEAPDGMVVSGKTDGALLVIRSGRVKSRQAESMKSALEEARIPVLGVVLNDTDGRMVHKASDSRGLYGKR